MSITLIIIIATAIVSIQGFSNASFRHRYMLLPYDVHHHRQWERMITSGFLHADWGHLLVNLYVLFIFGAKLENAYQILFGTGGKVLYVVMYLLAIVAANLSTYYRHRDNSWYASLGASGAVSAVLFGYILVYPSSSLMLLFLPIPVNAVIMGVLYLVYSYFMSQRGSDNINHAAHFYGALFGVAFLLVLKPSLILYFWEQILALL